MFWHLKLSETRLTDVDWGRNRRKMENSDKFKINDQMNIIVGKYVIEGQWNTLIIQYSNVIPIQLIYKCLFYTR